MELDALLGIWSRFENEIGETFPLPLCTRTSLSSEIGKNKDEPGMEGDVLRSNGLLLRSSYPMQLKIKSKLEQSSYLTSKMWHTKVLELFHYKLEL